MGVWGETQGRNIEDTSGYHVTELQYQKRETGSGEHSWFITRMESGLEMLWQGNPVRIPLTPEGFFCIFT